MALSEKYSIRGIITDACDRETAVPRKRLAIRFPHASTTRGIDIPHSTLNTPGQLKQAACAVLGISMSEIYVSDYLKRIIAGVT